MLAFSERIAFQADAALIHNSPISWIARDSSKPEREIAEDCWVAQANADWSEKNLEFDPGDVAGILVDSFFETLGVEPKKPVHAVAHRWRYATPKEHLDTGFLHDEEGQLFACGDWCLGNRVEAAFLSGTAAAGAVMRSVFIAREPVGIH